MPVIPNQINNFSLFVATTKFLGVADITLPDITNEEDSLKGAGIAGTINFPVLGQTQDMSVTINFHTFTGNVFMLGAQSGQQVEARGAIQSFDSSTNDLDIIPVRVVMQTLPKKFNAGKFEPGTKEDVSVELGVVALSIFYNGVKVMNVDKVNMVYEVNGVDYLQAVRQAIGF